MTNREKFAEQILDIACKGEKLAVDMNGNPIICKANICKSTRCKFFAPWEKDCEEFTMEWANSEYIEEPSKLSENDVDLMRRIPSGFNYIARNQDGNLKMYNCRPQKGTSEWLTSFGFALDLSCLKLSFPMIKWDDEEPWLIDNLRNWR